MLQNIHPLLVHFPIALVLVTLLFEAMWWLTNKEQFRNVATYLLYLSALFSVATIITGYVASNGLEHESPGHEFVHAHRDVMLWMSGLLLFTVLLLVIIPSFRAGKWRRLLIVPLLLVGVLLVYGADKGGRLVFEYGVGVKAVSEKAAQEMDGHEHKEQTDAEDSERTYSVPDSSRKSEAHSDEQGHVH